jgi:hypothetical protein
VQPVDESDEEEKSYDKNDSMSEEDRFGDGHIEISDDGNDYRSSLKPVMVKALVCASSWIKGAHNDNKVSLGVVWANVHHA